MTNILILRILATQLITNDIPQGWEVHTNRNNVWYQMHTDIEKVVYMEYSYGFKDGPTTVVVGKHKEEIGRIKLLSEPKEIFIPTTNK